MAIGTNKKQKQQNNTQDLSRLWAIGPANLINECLNAWMKDWGSDFAIVDLVLHFAAYFAAIHAMCVYLGLFVVVQEYSGKQSW